MNVSFLKSLQSLRIFAALGVVQFHLWHNHLDVNFVHPGTDFFLVLVGVVAAHNQASQIQNGNWWKYISGRYKRLYVTFVPLFIITLLAKLSEADVSWVVKSFLLIPMQDQSPVIGSTWMLSMFILFYFLFSIGFLLRTEKSVWAIFGVWLILILAYSFGGWSTGLPKVWSNLFFSERNIDFIMGYAVGTILRYEWVQSRHARIALWVGLAGILAGTVLLNLGNTQAARSLTIGLPTALFVLGIATLEQQHIESQLVKVLTVPALVWLGGTSYVLYLSHGMFFRVWSMVLPVNFMAVLPMTLGAMLAAALVYAFWEQPVLTYLKKGQWVMPQLPSVHVARKAPIRE